MKGAESHDGKMSGNRQLVDRYDESKGRHPKRTGGESGGAHEVSGHDEIKQVTMEHGKAHSHHVHDRGDGHEDGRYHVVTHHEDGYVHHADHQDLKSAHEHAAIAHEDTDHLGDMGHDDLNVADEHERMEAGRSGSSGTASVGFMR
jgi:hypothetical protein